MIYIILALGLCFCSYITYLIFFWQWKKSCQPFYNKEETLILGHRGSPTLMTENTIPSFQQAIEQGVDGIELDIRLSKDKQIVVFHDKDLKRMSNRTEQIKDLSLSELQTVVLHKQKGQLDDVYIPSLNDILPLLKDIGLINIEIKSDWLLQGHGIITPLIIFLNKHQIDDKCIISSFNPLILMLLRIRRPETVIGFLYNKKRIFHRWDNMIWMLRVQPENLHIHYSLLDSWVVKWARKKGMRINSYTINDGDIYHKAKAEGLNGVFTDNIEYLK